jgi:transcriptional regulator
MYDIPYFKAKHSNDVWQFIQEQSFATLIIPTNELLPAITHIPLIAHQKEGKWFLSGHIMRKTAHEMAMQKASEVVCVFQGPHAYVSAQHYEQPNTASTWNYMTAHVYGKVHWLDTNGLLAILTATTQQFEGDATGSQVGDMEPSYIQQHLKAIVGFEIEVLKVEHVFKLSQNKSYEERKRIIYALQANAETAAVAKAMERYV